MVNKSIIPLPASVRRHRSMEHAIGRVGGSDNTRRLGDMGYGSNEMGEIAAIE